ncbi:cupin domain-containing protein [bacterium]|nr:cupin domain-containing protein [bacterium]
MKIIDTNSISFDSHPEKNIKFKIVHKNENVTITTIKLNPNDTVPLHKVPVDVFFYIVKGSGEITIGDESKVVSAGEIIICPINTNMSLKANQGVEFVFMNVKTPSLK